ncbi:hypothetical protein LX36DRAFT_319510 [Colletotrichum falcatum]|nr:hypothetical protein LX36DRAFT_319510 [Colletotrichum falcatum]
MPCDSSYEVCSRATRQLSERQPSLTVASSPLSLGQHLQLLIPRPLSSPRLLLFLSQRLGAAHHLGAIPPPPLPETHTVHTLSRHNGKLPLLSSHTSTPPLPPGGFFQPLAVLRRTAQNSPLKNPILPLLLHPPLLRSHFLPVCSCCVATRFA